MNQAQLYIGGFSFSTNESELKQVFEEFGPVESLEIIRDAETGESRCFGFVEMVDADRAEKARAALDGQRILEKNLKVEWAQTDQTGRDEPGAVIW